MAKSNLQYFQNDWNKTVNWANTQHIAKNQWYPVYQLDLQRYANGEYPMSQAERARAILSSSSLEANTVLPSDIHSPSNVLGNARSDLQNIFTGLMPTRLFSSIWDGIKNTVEHPSELLDPKDNTLMQWVPGWNLIGEFAEGGWQNVLSHPVVTFLNLLPITDLGLTAVARAGMADSLAERAGITSDQLAGRGASHVGPVRLAGKLLSNTPTSKVGFAMGKEGFARDAEGNVIARTLTVGERAREYFTKVGIGSPQAQANFHLLQIEHHYSDLFRQQAEPFDLSVAKLDAPSQKLLYDLLTSGQSMLDILHNPNIPVDVKTAAEAFQDGPQNYFNEISMSSDKYAKVRMPDTQKVEIYINKNSNPVVAANKAADDAIAAVDKASAVTDQLAATINTADSQAAPIFNELQRVSPAIYQVMKGTDPLREQYEIDAIATLLRIDPKAVTLDQERMLDDVFSPGGLVAQLKDAYTRSDFKAYRTVALKLHRKFLSRALSPLNSPELSAVASMARDLYEYSKYRAKLEDQYLTKYDRTVKPLQEAAARAQKKFQESVVKNPPARFVPAYLKALDNAVITYDKGNELLDRAAKLLSDRQLEKSQVDAARQDPTLLNELVGVHAEGSYRSALADLGVPSKDIHDIIDSAQQSIARARAQGLDPSWVPTVSTWDAAERPNYGIRTPSTRIPSVDAEFERMFEPTNTIYDVGAAVHHSMSQFMTREAAQEVVDQVIKPWLVSGRDLEGVVNREYKPATTAVGAVSRRGFYEAVYDSLGYLKFDPERQFGISKASIGGEEDFYIPKSMLKSLQKAINENQFAMDKLFNRGTEVFRTSVLKFSPRFTAHILFGGTFLMALRTSPFAFKYIDHAYRSIKQGDHGELADILRRPTQFGSDEPIYRATQTLNFLGSKKLANLNIKERMTAMHLDPTKLTSWLKAAGDLNYTFTRWVTNMQRAIVYFDAIGKLERQGRRQGFVLDELGNRVQITTDRARQVAEEAVEKVMGDNRKMTPLEQASFTKVIPFYGWTKHILRYVSSYPLDHPFRASFLGNLANMNSEDTPSGLDTRIQLLFFWGSPDAQGNVTATDMRALDPLRDTASYATWQGWLSSLNPAYTALPAMVDPQIIFGDNVLYPNLTYNSLYGIKEAAPAGGPLTALEQYVPETTALDAALGLSSQYRGLARSDPKAYAKTIFSSLGVPFFEIQHINLRQISAQTEIDRYEQASAAATNAWQSGDFSQIAGYPTVPDPLQPDYNVTPASLEELYKKILATTGQPPSEVTPSLPAPNI